MKGLLYSRIHIQIYAEHNQTMTNFNEWTNTSLWKYISHTLFSKGLMLAVCERRVGDGDRLPHIDPGSPDPSSTSFSSWLGLLNRGSLRAQSPPSAAGSQFGILTPTDSSRPALVILLFNAHLLPLFFHLFTQVYLLIDGSVEGQYVTGLHNTPLRSWNGTSPLEAL